jgi:Fuc2NAc and GlcNAc transferase
MVVYYLVVFVFSLLLTFLVRRIAIRQAIMDIPNDRSSHTLPTPRGGGLAIVITWFLAIVYLYLYKQIEPRLFFAFLSGIPLVIISFMDDVMTLKPGIRFLFQSLSAILALYFLQGLKVVDVGFYSLTWTWAWTPIAFVGILWSINLFNFLDGIDGYIGAEIFFIGLAIALFFNISLGITLALAVLGFLVWNFPPAKIFMGDVGSTLLGFNVAILAIWYQNAGEASILSFLILAAAFWFDATITLLRRWGNKEKLSEAHRKHAYQRLVQSGLSHKQVTLGLCVFNLGLLVLAFLSLEYQRYVLVFFGLSLLCSWGMMQYADRRKRFA